MWIKFKASRAGPPVVIVGVIAIVVCCLIVGGWELDKAERKAAGILQERVRDFAARVSISIEHIVQCNRNGYRGAGVCSVVSDPAEEPVLIACGSNFCYVAERGSL